MQKASAQLIKKLRDFTGSPIAQCKIALENHNCDFEKAKEWLYQKGLTGQPKRANKIANEGLIGCLLDRNLKNGVMIESACETDFVAATDYFKEVTYKTTEFFLQNCNKINTIEELLNQKANKNETVDESFKQLASKMQEKCYLKRIYKVHGDFLGSYLHNILTPGLGKLGVIVQFKHETKQDISIYQKLGEDIAMQIVANKAKIEGEDKIQKLLKQEFLLNDEGIKVQDYIDQYKLGAIEIQDFKKFQVGE